MNDLDILRDAWPAPEPPSHRAREQVRADLLARSTRRPRRRWSQRLAAIGGVATAIAAGLVVVQNVGDGRSPSPVPAVPVASAAVLEAAARAAEDEPFTAPRADQWIYMKDDFGSDDVPNMREERWRRADGGGVAFYDDSGNLQVEMVRPRGGRKPVPFGPLAGYRQIAALPTDPDELRRWAYGLTDNIEGAGSTEHAEVYGEIKAGHHAAAMRLVTRIVDEPGQRP